MENFPLINNVREQMEEFDYSRNFWPRWRDYPDAFSAVFRSDSLSISSNVSVDRIKNAFEKGVGVKRAINPFWHYITTEKFNGTSIVISPHYPSVFKILKFQHQIPRFIGRLVSDNGNTKIEGSFSCTIISKMFNILLLLFILFFQLIGVLLITLGIFGKEPSFLVVGPLWFIFTYIIFKFYLFMLQVPKVHQNHIRKFIELLIQESEAH